MTHQGEASVILPNSLIAGPEKPAVHFKLLKPDPKRTTLPTLLLCQIIPVLPPAVQFNPACLQVS